MKKLIKWKWFPMVAVIAAFAVVVLVMALLGFRITYAPDLENSWEAISAVAAWAGVITSIAAVGASFAAVWFAIRVPKEIAEQQNKIALFEKKYSVYSSLLLIKNFSGLINNDCFKDNIPDNQGYIWHPSAKVELYLTYFGTVFGSKPELQEKGINLQSVSRTIALLKKHEVEVKKLPLLFMFAKENKDEITKELDAFFEPLFLFITDITTYRIDVNCEIDDMNRQKFISAVNSFCDKYADKIESEIEL